MAEGISFPKKLKSDKKNCIILIEKRSSEYSLYFKGCRKYMHSYIPSFYQIVAQLHTTPLFIECLRIG